MTYTRHRDAEETRNILEAQKIDGYDENDEDEQREFYAKFGVTADELEEPRYRLKLIQIKVWRLFNQPQNSTLAKVNINHSFYSLAEMEAFLNQNLSVLDSAVSKKIKADKL